MLSLPRTPTRPKGFGKKPKNFYTLHTGENNVFSIKIDECEKTTVVGFKKESDAIFIGKMIETQYIHTREWPDTGTDRLILPKSTIDIMEIVMVHQWEFDNLRLVCISNMMDLVSVNNISDDESHYSFSGDLYRFEAPIEFFQERFEELIRPE